MASLYLTPDARDAHVGSVVTLTGDEGRHAVAVARVRLGEKLSVGDGAGVVASGTVLSVDRDTLTLAVDEVAVHEAPRPQLWLAQGLAKGDRDELAVQAATELGVSGVIPWAAERSVSRWDGPKAAKGRERWASIVREATKQSIRPFVPTVEEVVSTAGLAKLEGQVLVLVPGAEVALTEVELDTERVTLVVGPEGGTSPRELEMLVAGGATLVRLGAEVLRTSTAGPAALAVLNARLGRW